MIQKLRSPRGPSAVELAEKVGVHHGTLSRWLKERARERRSRSIFCSTSDLWIDRIAWM
jgi:transcriptional regulator with XRE-family HTH domain